ncbi:ribulose-phosphate 3-epimerase [Candidatus Poribacteria bacterium]|nr:ribulose-phosphate 3-epimerase [Candidatus Poribacteria bacterium]
MANSVKISPSLMCADLCHLEDEVRRLERIGVDLLHFDLMDGHFVPNIPLGLAILEQLRSITDLPFDVHLMVENNELFIERLIPIGVDQIAVHVESAIHLDRLLSLIREHGIKAGAALNPSTPISSLTYVLERIDFVLIMTVNPGFSGQKAVPYALRKIKDCRKFLDESELNIPIEVDGNVSFENIPGMIAAGADILVAGTSSLFHKGGTLFENALRLKEAISLGLQIMEAQSFQGSG